MPKRILTAILCLIVLISVFGCNNTESGNTPLDVKENQRAEHKESKLFGFIVQEKDKDRIYEAMHSFITTSADIGKNAKLYRFTTEDELKNAVKDAQNDNCDAVLFYSEDFEQSAYAATLESSGIRTVSLVAEDKSCSCSIVLKSSDIDIIKVLTEYAGESSILVYSSTETDLAELGKQLKADGYNATLKSLVRTEYSYKKASEAVFAYLSENTDIKAVYVKGDVNTRPAFLAVKQIGNIRIIGSELSRINNEYVGHGMYALSVSPYYEMTAKAVYSMQKLANGQSAENEYCGAHLVTAEKLEKYVSISNNAQKWFGRS